MMLLNKVQNGSQIHIRKIVQTIMDKITFWTRGISEMNLKRIKPNFHKTNHEESM
jgi:hypothetical protein